MEGSQEPGDAKTEPGPIRIAEARTGWFDTGQEPVTEERSRKALALGSDERRTRNPSR
jgi:hypothetical protein